MTLPCLLLSSKRVAFCIASALTLIGCLRPAVVKDAIDDMPGCCTLFAESDTLVDDEADTNKRDARSIACSLTLIACPCPAVVNP